MRGEMTASVHILAARALGPLRGIRSEQAHRTRPICPGVGKYQCRSHPPNPGRSVAPSDFRSQLALRQVIFSTSDFGDRDHHAGEVSLLAELSVPLVWSVISIPRVREDLPVVVVSCTLALTRFGGWEGVLTRLGIDRRAVLTSCEAFRSLARMWDGAGRGGADLSAGELHNVALLFETAGWRCAVGFASLAASSSPR